MSAVNIASAQCQMWRQPKSAAGRCQFDTTNRLIARPVYQELNGLSEAEIRIVEEATAG